MHIGEMCARRRKHCFYSTIFTESNRSSAKVLVSGARKNTTQLVKYPRILFVKQSNKVFLYFFRGMVKIESVFFMVYENDAKKCSKPRGGESVSPCPMKLIINLFSVSLNAINPGQMRLQTCGNMRLCLAATCVHLR